MPYMNCPRCGLSIRLRASFLAIERCPRCLARSKVAVEMYLSQRPGEPSSTDDPGCPDGQPPHTVDGAGRDRALTPRPADGAGLDRESTPRPADGAGRDRD